MGMAYRRAVFCGAFPLAVGVSIFLFWVPTRWAFLMEAGLLALFGGIFFFLCGTVELVRFLWLGLRIPDLPRRRLWLRTAACAALLLSNFPVAAGIVVAVSAIESCYTVEIRNESAVPLEGARVTGPGCDRSFGTIAPGASERRRLWAEGEGDLVVEVRGNKTCLGYVCSGMGGRATVTIGPDGSASVR